MRTYKISIIAAVFLLVVACGKKLNNEFFVGPPQVETTELNSDLVETEGKLLATGRIVSEGDGIVEHGHIWSVDDPNLDITTGMKAVPGPVDEQGRYTSEVVLSVLNTNYYIRAYIKDVYDRVFYGEVFTQFHGDGPHADFTYTVSNDTFAPATVTFTNLSANYDRLEWDFGDGQKETEETNPSHPYPLPDTFKVTLTVWSDDFEEPSVKEKEVIIKARRYEGELPGYGPAGAVIPLSNSEYLIAGTKGILASQRIFVIRVRLNSDSTLMVMNEVAGLNSIRAEFGGMIELGTNDYAVVGGRYNTTTLQNDVFYFRTDGSGNFIGSPVTFEFSGRPGDDLALGITQNASGRVVVVGRHEDENSDDLELFIIEKDKNFGFHTSDFPPRILSGKAGINETGYGVVQSADGGYLIAGVAKNSSLPTDALFQKVDEKGVAADVYQTYGGSGFDNALNIYRIPGKDEYLLCGTYIDSASGADILLLKLNGSGNSVIPPQPRIDRDGDERGGGVAILADESVVIAGSKGTRAFLLKMDNSLSTAVWEREFEAVNATYFNAVGQTPDGGFVAVGGVGAASQELFLVKTDPKGQTNPIN